MIELTYIDDYEKTPIRKYFKTWKSLDKFVMKEKLEKYKVQGQSKGGNMIQYTSVLWEDFMAETFHKRRIEW